MSGETPPSSRQGLLNTNILALRRWIDPAELPDEMAVSAVTSPNCPLARTRSAPTPSRACTTSTRNAPAAIAEDLPLYTTYPDDYAGLEKLIRVVPVARPHLPHEKKSNPRG